MARLVAILILTSCTKLQIYAYGFFKDKLWIWTMDTHCPSWTQSARHLSPGSQSLFNVSDCEGSDLARSDNSFSNRSPSANNYEYKKYISRLTIKSVNYYSRNCCEKLEGTHVRVSWRIPSWIIRKRYYIMRSKGIVVICYIGNYKKCCVRRNQLKNIGEKS